MWDMDTNKTPDHLSVRLDGKTREQLDALVEHFNEGRPNGVTASHVVRYGIEILYNRVTEGEL